jgi:hypothetical protein
VLTVVKFIETESREWWLPRAERREWEVFNGNTVSVWKIKKFWRCMVVVVAYQCGIYLIPVSCTHK